MIRVVNAGLVEEGKQYVELSGLSTDSKPVAGILNGSLFHEIDTTAIYAFDEENATWIKQMQLGEDSTASVASSLSAPLSIPKIVNFGSGLNTADAEPEAVEEEAEPEEELNEVPQGGEEE